MAQPTASSCVQSIVSSFTCGLEVFKKFRALRKSKKHKTKRDRKTEADGQERLAASLRKGPEDIEREYQKGVSAIGQHFAHGDVLANTVLAEILLRLNTGLVTVVNAFLDEDKKETQLDYQTLTSLSDASRVETCRALRQLRRRALAQSDATTTNRHKPASRRTKARAPMLARVVIADSSKPAQVAMVRSGERKRKKQASKNTPATTVSNAQSITSVAATSAPPPAYQDATPTQLLEYSTTIQELLRPRRAPAPRKKQSAPVLSASAAQSADMDSWPPVRPSQSHPVDRSEFSRRTDRRPPTMYSEASVATKLGEIPLHKWAEPVDFDAMSRMNREAIANGWPLNEIHDRAPKKRRNGFLKLFRRKNSDA